MTMHMNTTDYKLGQMDEKIKSLAESNARIEANVDEMRAAIIEIKTTLAERKGERRVGMYVAGGLGSLVMLILSAIGRKIGFIS